MPLIPVLYTWYDIQINHSPPHRRLPTPQPPSQATKPHRNPHMPRSPPGHGKQKLWTKYRPDEKMLPQRRTSRHDRRQHGPRPKRQ